ncbi:MAG TPA: 50S ribosomal protein L24 [Verrucomicrobiae bacterium]|nr:50S ribosomal protein L24 [Verrucomicrobiae bacterium]
MNKALAIRKGDEVRILSGKDKGKNGKVLEVLPKDSRIVVEGVNIKVRFSRKKKQNEKGQRLELPAPFLVSKAILICPHCGKPTRVAHETNQQGKFRKCKQCGRLI